MNYTESRKHTIKLEDVKIGTVIENVRDGKWYEVKKIYKALGSGSYRFSLAEAIPIAKASSKREGCRVYGHFTGRNYRQQMCCSNNSVGNKMFHFRNWEGGTEQLERSARIVPQEELDKLIKGKWGV